MDVGWFNTCMNHDAVAVLEMVNGCQHQTDSNS